jgi:hypothetical protein
MQRRQTSSKTRGLFMVAVGTGYSPKPPLSKGSFCFHTFFPFFKFILLVYGTSVDSESILLQVLTIGTYPSRYVTVGSRVYKVSKYYIATKVSICVNSLFKAMIFIRYACWGKTRHSVSNRLALRSWSERPFPRSSRIASFRLYS